MVKRYFDIVKTEGSIPSAPTTSPPVGGFVMRSTIMGNQIKLEPDFSIPLNIVYEDDDVVVLNKQAGISVHPSVNEPNKTLVNALIAKYPEIKNVGDDPIRPGIVHRLDKDTSGLLVVAQNQKTFEFLKKEWQEGKVIKKYIALVWGHPKEKGEIVSELARSLKDFRKRMVVRPARTTVQSARMNRSDGSGGPEKQKDKEIKGKMAITEYKVVKKFRDFSLVEVSPKTGRMHQIRVQMASLGHPLAGDKIYSKSKKKPEGLTRQFLHAFYLKFSLPARTTVQSARMNRSDGSGGPAGSFAFEADLPDDLEQVLAKLDK